MEFKYFPLFGQSIQDRNYLTFINSQVEKINNKINCQFLPMLSLWKIIMHSFFQKIHKFDKWSFAHSQMANYFLYFSIVQSECNVSKTQLVKRSICARHSISNFSCWRCFFERVFSARSYKYFFQFYSLILVQIFGTITFID